MTASRAQRDVGDSLSAAPEHRASQPDEQERLTYGEYLRVPELLSLQSPRQHPSVPGEMLFIILQQAQELWFKQMLYDLHRVVRLLKEDRVPDALELLSRLNRVLLVLCEEVDVMKALPPAEFKKFRAVLKLSSGFESEQFRELELASGLQDETHERLVGRLLDLSAIRQRWPVTLHDVFRSAMAIVDDDVVTAVTAVYAQPSDWPERFALCEALSEYEQRFQRWRFLHLQVVERVIGDRSPGTGGSAGSGYLFHTLEYRFFPELWEARNRLTAQ